MTEAVEVASLSEETPAKDRDASSAGRKDTSPENAPIRYLELCRFPEIEGSPNFKYFGR